MGGVNKTADNLLIAFQGESFEIDQMYPAYQVAKLQGDKQAFKSMHWALKAEQDHKRMYAEAREKVARRRRRGGASRSASAWSAATR